MRQVSDYLNDRLNSPIQTRANGAAPSSRVWVGRPSTVLSDGTFLERQTVISGDISDVSIAVCHPKARQGNSRIFIGYISGGVAEVVSSSHRYAMESHEWQKYPFSQEATAISVAFDGTMPKALNGNIEFVTEDMPWVFWASGGALYGQKLGSEKEPVLLAESNCTDVSAVRAMWSSAGGFDFGLVVFFLLNGVLYYRQMIGGEWMDAEVVSFGPDGAVWSEISAFRTWDYRVGIQGKTSAGAVYELFTQFMGIGKQNAEHLTITGASVSPGVLTRIYFSDISNADEHINLSAVTRDTPYQGLWTLGVPSLTEVYNVKDSTGDWGKEVVFQFDKELNNEQVQESLGSFYFVDSEGYYYFPSSIDMDITGRKARLSFVNINNAVGVCTAKYVPGTVTTMLEEPLAEQTVEFVPQNLVPIAWTLPEVARIWNTNETGTEVAIQFTQPLTEVPEGSAGKFIVTVSEPEYSPGGPLHSATKPVMFVTRFTENDQERDDTIVLHFDDGMFTNIRNAVGDVFIQYTGTLLRGEEGPVLGFRNSFLPVGLAMKPNPGNVEHLEIGFASAYGYLTEITYSSTELQEEHLVLSGAALVSTSLIHIDDL